MNCLYMTVLSLVLAARGAHSGAVPVAAASADYPRYAFKYAVHDPVTKDHKAQWEKREGDGVKGSYQLVEPDGSLRIVDYSANDATGFNAVVKNILPNLHPTPIVAKAVAPLVPIAGPVNYGFGPTPFNYGFGAAPVNLGHPKLASLGQWSLPWDPHTHSYGGWVPLTAPLLPLPTGPYATVFSKKYVDGKLHKWATGPISLIGNTLVLKKKH